jgi:ABC-type glycerol-3-phosphate transport system permease component
MDISDFVIAWHIVAVAIFQVLRDWNQYALPQLKWARVHPETQVPGCLILVPVAPPSARPLIL